MGKQFQKKVENNSINFRLLGIVLALILGLVIYNFSKPVKGSTSDLVQILPTTYTIYNLESGEWHNVEKALSQDLGSEADFNEFTTENSAYPMEIENSIEPEILESLLALDELATDSEELPVEESPIIEEPIIEESEPEENLPTEEALIEEEILPVDKPILIEKYLEFSDFTMPSEFTSDAKKIENIQLRLSLAVGGGMENEKLIIEYSNKSYWDQLAEINLNEPKSNYSNNGYWLYALPIFDDWNDLSNLQIRFSYSAIKPKADTILNGFVYLDALWLEVQYQVKQDVSQIEESPDSELSEQDLAQLQAASILNPRQESIEFVNPKKVFFWNEEPEFNLPKLTSNELLEKVWLLFGPKSEIREANLTLPDGSTISPDIDFIESKSPKIRIKKLTDFQPGTYAFKVKIFRAGVVYTAETQFQWQIKSGTAKIEINVLKDEYSISLEGKPIKSKKFLKWHKDEFDNEKGEENKDINVNVSSKGDESSLNISGDCTMAYFVILVYRNADDYEKNPALFVYNKAFPCVSGRYQYNLDDLPPSLKDGTYYLLVGQEGETGSWQPITSIQPIQIKSK